MQDVAETRAIQFEFVYSVVFGLFCRVFYLCIYIFMFFCFWTLLGACILSVKLTVYVYTHFIKLVLTFFGLYGIRTFLGLPPLFKNFVSKIFLVHVIFEFF